MPGGLHRAVGLRSIVRIIVNIGNELGITVVAEGVKTRGQLSFLHEQGCNIGQAYLFLKPRTAGEIDRLLRTVSSPQYPLIPDPRGRGNANPHRDERRGTSWTK